MKLYIKLENGQPIDHPMIKENFIQAFPHIDIDNLPPEFIEFVRVPHPVDLDIYEICTESTLYFYKFFCI